MPSVFAIVVTLLAGLAAGMINAVVGSGTLISFPVLASLGLPPVTANMVSSLGLLAGNASSIAGYRTAIRDGRELLRSLLPASIAGGLVGALLLLWLPESVFKAAVPFLVGLGLILVAVGPLVQRALARDAGEHSLLVPQPVVILVTFLVAVYGGYFGAAQGIILIGFLGLLTTRALTTINGVKVILVLAVNIVSGVIFVVTGFGRIDWRYVAILAAGSVIGGFFGSHIGARMPAWLLRAVVLVVGTAALIVLILRG